MRQPIQTLVFLFRHQESVVEFLLLHRSDLKCWQGVAGGVEGHETTSEAALREVFEETGTTSSQLINLESHCTIPVEFVTGFLWGVSVLNVKEFTFGLEVPQDFEVVCSHEHDSHRWCRYEEAMDLLKWDSNRNALWELNHRLIADH